MGAIPWEALSKVYAFVGNSVLAPMSINSPLGLSVSFWDDFPSFDNPEIKEAVLNCRQFAFNRSSEDGEILHQAIEDCSFEYTRLFVGPPKPFAPPWETIYRGVNTNVGFGEPTFEMKKILREAGFRLSDGKNQYEDHIGIELLYLSQLCLNTVESVPQEQNLQNMLIFMETHPLGWVSELQKAVDAEFPEGYYSGILKLVIAVLTWHSQLLKSM